jgi:hypothetical protein
MTLNSVVLPAPFGPMRPVIEPSPTDSVHPASAATPPKRLVMPVTVSSWAVTAPPWRAASNAARLVEIAAYHRAHGLRDNAPGRQPARSRGSLAQRLPEDTPIAHEPPGGRQGAARHRGAGRLDTLPRLEYPGDTEARR